MKIFIYCVGILAGLIVGFTFSMWFVPLIFFAIILFSLFKVADSIIHGMKFIRYEYRKYKQVVHR